MTSNVQPQNQHQSLVQPPSAPSPNTSGAGSTSNIVTQPSSGSSPQQHSQIIDSAVNDSNTLPTQSGTGGAEAASENEPLAGQDKGRGGEPQNTGQPGLVKEEGEVHPEHANGQIELLEHTPDAAGGSGVAAGSGGDDWFPENEHEMKRVKVYELIGSRWADQGTAFCFGQFQEETGEALLIARSERNYSQVILSTAIRSNDVYQRQQDTLIVWTEPDGVDYALSFQDPEGCAEVWSFILEVQRHMNGGGTLAATSNGPPTVDGAFAAEDPATVASSPVVGSETSVTTASIIRSGHLPTPTLGIIGEVEKAIKALARTQPVKERICEYIQQEDYIKSLIEVLTTAEDLESLENLHALCSLMQTILMLNDHSMYEHILEDELFFGVVGMLEYDPDFPSHKANYREFLRQSSHFHEPIPIRDPMIQRKIHHTYRLQFLKDVIDIITHVQQDHGFLRDIVRLFVDEDMLSGGGNHRKAPPTSTPASARGRNALRREVVMLVQQLCVMGKNVQLPARMALFRALVDRGVLFGVQWALGLSEKQEINKPMISAGGEILAALLDHDLNGVRGHVLKQVVAIDKEREAGKKGADKAETILEMSYDLAVQSQVGDALKAWMDIPLSDTPAAAAAAAQAAASDPSHPPVPVVDRRSQLDGRRTLGLSGTWILLQGLHRYPLQAVFDLPEWRTVTAPILPLSREQTNRYVYLCDLLYNFTHQHGFRSNFYLMASNIMLHSASLLKARDKHLRHASFRLFRLLLKQNNPTMHNLLMRQDILEPILDLTLRESRRDNLVSCSCQEFFEQMRRDNMKEWIAHCLTRHESKIRKLAESPLGGQRFELLIRRWEMNNEPLPEDPKPEKPVDNRWPGQGRALDVEEEDYFNGDDDEDEGQGGAIPAISQAWSRFSGVSSPIPMNNGTRRRRRPGVGSAPKGYRPPLHTPILGSLVDYGDDDDDGASTITVPSQIENLSASSSSDIPPSSPKLLHRQIAMPMLPNGPPPKRISKEEDEEDNLLESLVRGKSKPGSPASTPTSAPISLPLRSEKRRRDSDDDDDDEMLGRLSKVKKPDPGAPARGKNGDDPPRKLKLNLG
ncbi:component of IIS longevity pathway SMK-1-domain-containing protein [Infundibulicybe gibba]|nr:component of IIS longevity pathway SMK-1-domain-containing protein [Infundibulicybe gibba]